MVHNEGPVEELSEAKSWQLLRDNSLGRLAVSAAGELDIFPINYYADGSTILLRTAPGTKLVEMTIHGYVAFEIDGYSDTEAWSVVVKGSARWLDSRAEIDEADAQPLTSWIPTLKYVYVRITPTHVSGRRFVRGVEPERD
jgi:nitroimidazol reductase NimA-like FMN-containing flavoprotein (pyridoxamine 5'-phosphate oxidase superfamily)